MTDHTDDQMRLIQVARNSPDIFGADSRLAILRKAAKLAQTDREAAQTNAGVSFGTKAHLIEKLTARELRDFNSTHAICIDAKKAASLGLGHREQRVHEVLDPLTRFSWQDVLDALAEDYWETGECFLEVVFGDEDNPRRVTGLHHLESARVFVELEQQNESELYHYCVEGEVDGGENLVMAKWGDLEDLKARFGQGRGEGIAGPNANTVVDGSGQTLRGSIVNSEIIHIRQATNRSRYYGYPDYMSAVPSIELVQCMTQHEFDFYFNRGVPEFLLFLLGTNLGKCWEDVTRVLKSGQGPGNGYKSGAIHIPGSPEQVRVQVEKLALEDAANSGFSEKSNTLDMRIATAHGMPPQLANIVLPGKMGAANEGPNAMLTFQMRKLGQAQKNFSRSLACTLGDRDISFAQPTGADQRLSADLFLARSARPMTDDGVPQFIQPGNGFNTILDGMTLGAADTMSRMREPLAGSGRDPGRGLLDGARERSTSDPRRTRGPGTGR